MARPGTRTLIIDSHVAVAQLVARICRLIHVSEIEIAFDTLTARRSLEERVPDIVVIDAHAGPMKLTAFITLAKRVSQGKAITLLMTTSLEADGVRAAREAGVDAILLKPFTPATLQAQIGAVLASRSHHEAAGQLDYA